MSKKQISPPPPVKFEAVKNFPGSFFTSFLVDYKLLVDRKRKSLNWFPITMEEKFMIIDFYVRFMLPLSLSIFFHFLFPILFFFPCLWIGEPFLLEISLRLFLRLFSAGKKTNICQSKGMPTLIWEQILLIAVGG